MPSLCYTELLSIISRFPEFNFNNIKVFYESGTYYGTTTLGMQPYFEYIITTEVSTLIYNNIHTYLLQFSNILHINGASENILEDILLKTFKNNEIIFFLDGHYSSEDTSFNILEVPLLQELEIINKYYKKNTILIIDDYNLFETNINEDWSNISITNILNCFTYNQIYNYYIENNRMIIIIKEYT